MLPVWGTAAMLVSFRPLAPWQDYLRLIWELEDDDGVNFTVLAALDSRTRRRLARPVDPSNPGIRAGI